MRLITDGVVDRDGVAGLAARLGYSTRQVERQLLAELGAGPLALARAQRSQTARLLIETTSLPMSQVASAAGFASVRAFNDTVREVFASSPTELRNRARRGQVATAAGVPRLCLRLPYRLPMGVGRLFAHLAAHAVVGVEEWRGGAYRRTLRLPHGPGIVALRPLPDHIGIGCQLALTDLRDLAIAISRCRWLLDLDADPVATDAHLSGDPLLAPQVARQPGQRVPRTVDGAELAVRTVLSRGLSAPAAKARIARLVSVCGDPIADHDETGGLTHLFPTPEALEELDPASLGFSPAHRDTLTGLVTALVVGKIEVGVGSDWQRARAQLAAVAGIGPWTVETIAMRALGDPDAFPDDPGICQAARRVGLPTARQHLTVHATAWRPWRAYAAHYLWAAAQSTNPASGRNHTGATADRSTPQTPTP
jgi:AraC family transcriptional regulator of adaptative response / DNA-3-methyladenine glycosylase II